MKLQIFGLPDPESPFEKEVINYLKGVLTDEHGYLLNQLTFTLPKGRQLQIDHILFLSRGIFIIETKGIRSSSIHGSINGQWTTSDRYLVESSFALNPAQQVKRYVRQFKIYIERAYGYKSKNVWLFPIVIMPDNVRLDIQGVAINPIERLQSGVAVCNLSHLFSVVQKQYGVFPEGLPEMVLHSHFGYQADERLKPSSEPDVKIESIDLVAPVRYLVYLAKRIQEDGGGLPLFKIEVIDRGNNVFGDNVLHAEVKLAQRAPNGYQNLFFSAEVTQIGSLTSGSAKHLEYQLSQFLRKQCLLVDISDYEIQYNVLMEHLNCVILELPKGR